MFGFWGYDNGTCGNGEIWIFTTSGITGDGFVEFTGGYVGSSYCLYADEYVWFRGQTDRFGRLCLKVWNTSDSLSRYVVFSSNSEIVSTHTNDILYGKHIGSGCVQVSSFSPDILTRLPYYSPMLHVIPRTCL